VEEKLLPSYYYGDMVLFALSCSLLFHCLFFEPHNMRPSYWNFLMGVSEGKLKGVRESVTLLHGKHADAGTHPGIACRRSIGAPIHGQAQTAIKSFATVALRECTSARFAARFFCVHRHCM
jgi:hypothetical protein